MHLTILSLSNCSTPNCLKKGSIKIKRNADCQPDIGVQHQCLIWQASFVMNGHKFPLKYCGQPSQNNKVFYSCRGGGAWSCVRMLYNILHCPVWGELALWSCTCHEPAWFLVFNQTCIKPHSIVRFSMSNLPLLMNLTPPAGQWKHFCWCAFIRSSIHVSLKVSSFDQW